MANYVWLVFTNPVAGQEDEFNRWYDEIHIPDLRRVPGLQSAKRSKLVVQQMQTLGDGLALANADAIGATYSYLAQYQITTNDIDAFLADVLRRSTTDQMMISPALGDAYTVMYQDQS